MAKASASNEQEKGLKRSKGKGKVTKEPEASKVEAAADNGFSLFKSASAKDAELDDLFSKSVGAHVSRDKQLLILFSWMIRLPLPFLHQ